MRGSGVDQAVGDVHTRDSSVRRNDVVHQVQYSTGGVSSVVGRGDDAIRSIQPLGIDYSGDLLVRLTTTLTFDPNVCGIPQGECVDILLVITSSPISTSIVGGRGADPDWGSAISITSHTTVGPSGNRSSDLYIVQVVCGTLL